jgi:hypothetical protein
MQTDLAIARPLRNALHLSQVERLSRFAAHRTFDLDSADRNRDAARRTTLGFAL